MEKRYVGPVAYVPKGDRGFWFVLWNERRLYCHISNYSELEPPKFRDLVSFEIGPALRQEFGIQAVKIRPATKEELNTSASTLKEAV